MVEAPTTEGETETDMKWEVGEEVIYYSGGIRSVRSVKAVERVLASGRFGVAGRLFNEDGTERGGGAWSTWRVRKATAESLAEVRQEGELRMLRSRVDRAVSRSKINGLTAEQCRAILEAVT